MVVEVVSEWCLSLPPINEMINDLQHFSAQIIKDAMTNRTELNKVNIEMTTTTILN